MWYLLCAAVGETAFSAIVYISFAAWIFFTKLVKLIPHFWRHPQDLKYIPLSILFSYAHGFLNIYALCTMMNTAWGSQNLRLLEAVRTGALLEEVEDHANGLDSGGASSFDGHDSPLEEEEEGEGGTLRRRGRSCAE
jgi:hypothetical protein